MDNNNPAPQTPASLIPPTPQPNPQPQPTAPFQTPPPPPEQPSGSNKMVLWLIIGLVLIVLVVGGIYLYLSRQQAANNLQTSVTQTPTPVQENLENDLNSVDIGNLDQEFSTVDQDLQQL